MNRFLCCPHFSYLLPLDAAVGSASRSNSSIAFMASSLTSSLTPPEMSVAGSESGYRLEQEDYKMKISRGVLKHEFVALQLR